LEQPKNSRLGVTDRGSEVYQTAVSFALDNAMKDAEGAALPRALIAVTFLLFLSTAAFPFAPRMNDGKNLINSEERSHWLTYASSVPIAVGWLYVAAAFFRSHALGWGRTTVVVAHRLSTIVNANKIHVFSNGTIAESGTHRSLLEKNGIYANLISKQRGDVHPSNKLSLGSVHTPRLDTEGAVAATAAKPAELRINVRPKSNRPSNSPFTSWDGKMEPVEQADPPSRPPLHYQPRNIGKSRSASSSPSRKRGGSINS